MLDAEPSRDALVRERRVDVAVAHDVGAGGYGRANDLVDELRARGGEERGLGPRRDVDVVLEEQRANTLAELRPSRLAGCDDVPAVRAKCRDEQFRLRRLAAAVDSLERHEHSAGG